MSGALAPQRLERVVGPAAVLEALEHLALASGGLEGHAAARDVGLEAIDVEGAGPRRALGALDVGLVSDQGGARGRGVGSRRAGGVARRLQGALRAAKALAAGIEGGKPGGEGLLRPSLRAPAHVEHPLQAEGEGTAHDRGNRPWPSYL